MTELPTTFGKYYLTEKLATGGMAEIYLGKLIGPGGFEKPLVIKQIHPRLSGNRHFVDLFVAEAKTLVGLAHGNIVPVYELGMVDDTYFIAMEYVDGPTLYRLTETMAGRGAVMDPPLAAWIAARILEGLDYAHRKGEGVIHRDLSPRNVMLSRDGEVKLVDFGIAVTLGEPGETAAAQSAPTGSFPYMSPEQVRREPLTPQTDLFSAGVLCWEMLAGRRLFARRDADATLAAVLGDDIPLPSSERPDVPARLDEVVMRALARDRAERWPDAAGMLAALQRYLYGLDETPGPRDLAALVARFCPPSTRRLPTHLEAAAHDDGHEPLPGPATTPTAPAEPPGPRTVVIPREAAARGKPQRARTFATHVELKDALDRATPLFPLEAIDAPAPAPDAAAASEPAPSSEPPPASPEPPRLGARPPGRGILALAGVGVIGLAIATTYVVLTARAAVLAEDAGDFDVAVPSRDARLAPDAAIDAPSAPTLEAEPPADARAAIPVRPDAAPHPHHSADAAPRAHHPDAAPVAMATLAVGASPWGEVYIDGKHVGRAPDRFATTAGHHVVQVVLPIDPPRKQTFEVDLAPDATTSVLADLTH